MDLSNGSSALVRRGGGSSQTRRRLDLEDDIIRIPECDLTEVSERFKLTLIGRVFHPYGRSIEALIVQLPKARIWNVEGRVRGTNLGEGRFQFDFDSEKDLQMVLNKRPCHFNQWSFALERWEPFTRDDFPNTIPFWIKVIGVPIHFWNDNTFTEIAKALGSLMAIDANRSRIQVSVKADVPLIFEKKIGFPNGDVGKIAFEYEGLHRHCFNCKLISHDENNCPELNEEEREIRRKQRIELNQSNNNNLLPFSGYSQQRHMGSKRQRSPVHESTKLSSPRLSFERNRGDKRSKDAEKGWVPRSYSGWDRQVHGFSKDGVIPSGQGDSTILEVGKRPHRGGRNVGAPSRDLYRQEKQLRGPDLPRSRHRTSPPRLEWRPKNRHPSARAETYRAISKEALPDMNNRNSSVGFETVDSQRTISELATSKDLGTPLRNGILVIHPNETEEEKNRRLKGKGRLDDTPTSGVKKGQESINPLVNKTLVIHEPIEDNQQRSGTRFVSSVPERTLDTVLTSSAKEMVEEGMIGLSLEEEAELENLENELEDVVMDDNMIDNDDLLGEDVVHDAEIIEAISQLSPANAVYTKEAGPDHVDYSETVTEHDAANEKKSSDTPFINAVYQVPEIKKLSHVIQSGQGGVPKKKSGKISDPKGLQASKKLSTARGRPSPRKKPTSGFGGVPETTQ